MNYYTRQERHGVGQYLVHRNGCLSIGSGAPYRWLDCGLVATEGEAPPDSVDAAGDCFARYVPVPQERLESPLWELIAPTAKILH